MRCLSIIGLCVMLMADSLPLHFKLRSLEIILTHNNLKDLGETLYIYSKADHCACLYIYLYRHTHAEMGFIFSSDNIILMLTVKIKTELNNCKYQFVVVFHITQWYENTTWKCKFLYSDYLPCISNSEEPKGVQ